MNTLQNYPAQFVIVSCLFWIGCDFLTLREDFPFAAYNMYTSAMSPDQYTLHTVRMITRDGQEVPMSYLLNGALSESALVAVLEKKINSPQAAIDLTNTLKQVVRTANVISGDRIVGAKFYQQKWGKLTHLKNQPEQNQLVAEYSLDGEAP